jgi:tryptophan synthase alpha chain
MNRIDKLFKSKSEKILTIYFTPGYPDMDSIEKIIFSLQGNGVDMIEIGIPFSDPMADGPVIQNSNKIALQNGINLHSIFMALERVKKHVSVPIILMGYFNTIYKYGVRKYLDDCSKCGVSGSIIPDLPLLVYKTKYKSMFEASKQYAIFIVSPGTNTSRLKDITENAKGFIYMVSSSSITGNKSNFDEYKGYYNKIKMGLNNIPFLMGFGIVSKNTFREACKYANGGIIGSAYIKKITGSKNIAEDTESFVKNILS